MATSRQGERAAPRLPGRSEGRGLTPRDHPSTRQAGRRLERRDRQQNRRDTVKDTLVVQNGREINVILTQLGMAVKSTGYSHGREWAVKSMGYSR